MFYVITAIICKWKYNYFVSTLEFRTLFIVLMTDQSTTVDYRDNEGLRDGLSWVTDVTGQDKVAGQDFFFSVSAVLLSTFILLFLFSSSVSLSYFNLAVPRRKCLGKHSCMSSPFSIVTLNATYSLRAPYSLFCGDVPALKKTKLQTNKQKRDNDDRMVEEDRSQRNGVGREIEMLWEFSKKLIE